MPVDEDAPDHVSATGFSYVPKSFDIEDEGKQQRRRKSDADLDAGPRPSRVPVDPEADAVTSCPGCGSEVEEGEYVESLLSFVTGAKDYLRGDPVRVRSVQQLQRILPGGKMPDPQSDWGIEVVARIEEHVEKMAEERARMIVARERQVLEGKIRKQIEAEVRDQIIAAANGVAELPPALDPGVALPFPPPTPQAVTRQAVTPIPTVSSESVDGEGVMQPPQIGQGPPNPSDAGVDEDGVSWWQDDSGQWWYQPPTADDWFAWQD